jgi:hypothetical protein
MRLHDVLNGPEFFVTRGGTEEGGWSDLCRSRSQVLALDSLEEGHAPYYSGHAKTVGMAWEMARGVLKKGTGL